MKTKEVKSKLKLESICELCGKVIKATSTKRLLSALSQHYDKIHETKSTEDVDRITAEARLAVKEPEPAPNLDAILNHPLVQAVLSKVTSLESTVAQLTENNNRITEALTALTKSNNAMQEQLAPVAQAPSQQPQNPNPGGGFSISPQLQSTIIEAITKRLMGGGGDQFNLEAFKKQAEMMSTWQEIAQRPVLLAMQNLTARAKFYMGLGLDEKKTMQALESDSQGQVK